MGGGIPLASGRNVDDRDPGWVRMKKFETEVRLSREMTLMDATFIGVGAMIGAGIFVLTGIAAGVAGPGLILVFFLNGFVALLTAMSYAELGSCYHDAGGGYLWVKEGLPRWNGFLAGWMSWFAHSVACSVYALGFGAYFDLVLHEFGTALPHWELLPPQKLLAAAVAMLFTYINYKGAAETGKIGNLVTTIKIAILAVFIGFGLQVVFKRPDWTASFTPFLPNGWSGVFSAMGLTFIAFEGYELIAQSSEEVKHPRKNIPRAVFWSLLIVVPIYLLVAFVALGAVRPETMTAWDYLAAHKETALVEVARNFFAGGGVMLLIGGLVSTVSALNATIYSSSRVAFAMGRDRNFPAFFAKVHKKNFTPHWGLVASLIIIVGMAISLPIEDVASAADIMFMLLFLQVNLAMIRLRKKRPDLNRGFIAPFFPWLSIVGILALFFLALSMFAYSPAAWVVTAGWIAAGLAVYHGYASKREIQHEREVEELDRLERKDYRILVSVSKPSSAKSLTHAAIAIAKAHNAEIILLHVIEVEEGQSLMAGLRERARVLPLLKTTEDLVQEAGVPVRVIIKLAHRISQAIIETADEERCNFIVLWRQKHPKFFERFFSSVIDTVIQDARCEVAILHGDFDKGAIRTIFIPYGQNIHARLAIEMAPALAEFFHCAVRIGVVVDPDSAPDAVANKLAEINALIKERALSAELETRKSPDILRGVLQLSHDADLILMGGKSGDFLELLIGRSLSQDITEQSRCPVLWFKEYEEVESFWASLIKPHAKEDVRHE
jgi:amino acid transporter/nucleotide-binding universal stress UspA family protein